jgi:peptide/nickel transport system substrate-binding protein
LAATRKGWSIKTKAILSIVIVVVAAVVGAVGYNYYLGLAEKEQQSRTLIIAYTVEATTLDPAIDIYASTENIWHAIYDTLLQYDVNKLKTGEYVLAPSLAETWQVSDDRLQWTFNLRHDAKFAASGNPVNAQAVKFSFERFTKLNQSQVLFMYDAFQSIDVVDNYTVRITLKYPFTPILSILSQPFSSIIDPSILQYEKNGDFGSNWLADHSAGSGPYVLESFTRNTEVVLTRNDQYWKGPSYFEKVIYKSIPEHSEQAMMLRRGDADIACNLLAEDIPAMQNTTSLNVVTSPSMWSSMLYVNLNVKPMENPMIREAIRYAIDYEGLVKIAAGGQGVVMQTPVVKGVLYYDEEFAHHYTHDVQKAKQLLAEAGYPNGIDLGYLDFPYLSLLFSLEKTAVKIQSDLADAGITVQLRGAETGTWWNNGLDGKWGALIVSASGYDYPDPDEFAYLLSPTSIGGMLGWTDSQYMSLILQARGMPDSPERDGLYKEIQQKLIEGPYVFLQQPFLVFGASRSLNNVVWNVFAQGPEVAFMSR